MDYQKPLAHRLTTHGYPYYMLKKKWFEVFKYLVHQKSKAGDTYTVESLKGSSGKSL